MTVIMSMTVAHVRMSAEMDRPATVKIVEVGPRDGLQNEVGSLPAPVKIALIDRLADAGLKFIEAGSFVSAKWVPSMADTAKVMSGISRKPGVVYSVLTPNMKGFEAARTADADEVAVFAAASETFSQKNINCSVAESLDRFTPVCEAAAASGVPVRGYISCVLDCPYEGPVEPAVVAGVAGRLLELGCHEISLGDTIGRGTPDAARQMVAKVSEQVPIDRLAVHFHDTYGQALANILAVMEQGVAVIDSSVAGLGGCPYADGAAGNVASEDVLFMLDGLGVETGVDLEKLVEAGRYICGELGRQNGSKTGHAMLS